MGGLTVKIVDRIALILVIIGALNWGSIGLFRFDCVAAIFGGQHRRTVVHHPAVPGGRCRITEKTAA